MAEEAVKETWEFDVSKLTFDDLVVLETASETEKTQFGTLQRLVIKTVINKSPEDVKELLLVDVQKILDALLEAIEGEMRPPKRSVTA